MPIDYVTVIISFNPRPREGAMPSSRKPALNTAVSIRAPVRGRSRHRKLCVRKELYEHNREPCS